MPVSTQATRLDFEGLDEVLQKHIEVLRCKVFESTKYHPQFDLLLADLISIRNELTTSTCIVSVERMLMYGKNLFAPLFDHARFVSLDLSPSSADSRGAYNAHLIDHPDFIDSHCQSIRCELANLDRVDLVADFVLIPNLVHHVKDQNKLWSEVRRVLRPGGVLYVFEPTLREIHQDPDDYLRYTPNGLTSVLAEHGLITQSVTTTGGPFTAIGYCWTQALQYIDSAEKARWTAWFESHFADLQRLENAYPNNLVRQHTSFPTAFSLRAVRA